MVAYCMHAGCHSINLLFISHIMKEPKIKKYLDRIILFGTPIGFLLIALSEGLLYWIGGIMTVLIAGQYLLNYILPKD